MPCPTGAGGPPPYNIDLTEEIGSSLVNWIIYQKEQKIGRATSLVERQPNRTYQLRTQLYFDKLRLPFVEINKISTAYHVTEDGELLGLSAQFVVHMQKEEFDLEMQGEVDDGAITPKLLLNKQRLPLGEVKVPLTGTGNIVNPLQLLNRVPGLSEGRHWRMTLFDPLKALGKAFPEYKEVFAAAEGTTTPELRAEVVADTLQWDAMPVPCYKIEYRKPGEPDPVAATWVRRRDGLVLQQFSSSGLMDMTVRRVPVH